jgi:phosphate transport system substrate-binding protein
MYIRITLVIVLLLLGTPTSAQLKASGSTFAQDLYTGWSEGQASQKGASVAYLATGSSAGIRAAQDGTVDFGASEQPMSREQLARGRIAQFPAALGGVVVIANLRPVAAETVTLNGAILADIFLGTIKRWNDPAVAKLNPTVRLPDLAIAPIIRSGGSGTAFVFMSYLAKTSAKWGAAGGAPVASAAQVASNKAMADAVLAKVGSIGFVEFSFTQELSIPSVKLVNRWGSTVVPSVESIKQTAQTADWELIRSDPDPTFELDLIDAGCPRCWPIATATYVLVPLRGKNVDRVFEFMRLGLGTGQATTEKLGYVALPPRAEGIVRAVMSRLAKGS